MMKKLAAIAFAACFATTAYAAISGGEHDLSAGGNIGDCMYCHAPHLWVSQAVTGAPLWNRNLPAASSFTVYSSATLDGSIALGPNSLTCLSCHDGVGDMYAVLNGISGKGPTAMNGSYAEIGKNLLNDHPVGVAYNAASAEYVDAPALPLYDTGSGNQVECASCHDPHGTSDGARSGLAFLRLTTTLCAACHQK